MSRKKLLSPSKKTGYIGFESEDADDNTIPLETKEGELHMAMELLIQMEEHLQPQHSNDSVSLHGRGYVPVGGENTKNTIHLRQFLPKGWGLQRTYAKLFAFAKMFEIELEVVLNTESLDFGVHNLYDGWVREEESLWQDKTMFDAFFREKDWNCLFFAPVPLEISEKFLRLVHIKRSFGSKESIKRVEDFIIERLDEFVGGHLSQQYNLLSYEAQRKLIMKLFFEMYESGEKGFLLSYEHFSKHERTAPIYMLALLWKLGYVRIYSVPSQDYSLLRIKDDGDGFHEYLEDSENPLFEVMVTTKAISMLSEILQVRDAIVEKIFHDGYKQLRIRKKKGDLFYVMEGEIEIPGDSKKIVEIMREYPYADILIRNYDGKPSKIIINEKSRLETDAENK